MDITLDGIKPNAARTKNSVLFTNVILSTMQFDVGFIEYSILSTEIKCLSEKTSHFVSKGIVLCADTVHILEAHDCINLFRLHV